MILTTELILALNLFLIFASFNRRSVPNSVQKAIGKLKRIRETQTSSETIHAPSGIKPQFHFGLYGNKKPKVRELFRKLNMIK
jgi:hypothetical protein